MVARVVKFKSSFPSTGPHRTAETASRQEAGSATGSRPGSPRLLCARGCSPAHCRLDTFAIRTFSGAGEGVVPLRGTSIGLTMWFVLPTTILLWVFWWLLPSTLIMHTLCFCALYWFVSIRNLSLWRGAPLYIKI